MNFKHFIFTAAAAMCLCSCGTEDKETEHEWLPEFSDFNEQGYWKGCYDTSGSYVDVNGFRFTHSAESYDWGGVTYSSWYGFCPSRSTDNADYSDQDWMQHQWSSITGGGVGGASTPYLVGFWKTDGGETSCRMTMPDGGVFYPDDLYVTNTTYGYYAMKNGTAFNHAFTDDDSCVLCINGYLDGVRKYQTLQVYLAKGTKSSTIGKSRDKQTWQR